MIQNKKHIDIARRLTEPIEVGDEVEVKIPHTTVTRVKKGRKIVEEIKTGTYTTRRTVLDKFYGKGIDDYVYKLDRDDYWSVPFGAETAVEGYVLPYSDNGVWVFSNWITHCVDHIGEDPFLPAPDIRFYNVDIDSLLSRCGYGRRRDDFLEMEREDVLEGEDVIGTYGGANFDPYVIGERGVEVHYQRGYVWNDEQKSDLISTIYRGGEIGKFVFRYRSWKDLMNEVKRCGHGYNRDCVDGKQRFAAILGFVRDEFRDEHGNRFSDLSNSAQRRFLCYDKISYGEMNERCTDADTLAAFLHVNNKGTPVSAEHVKYVSNIKLKTA